MSCNSVLNFIVPSRIKNTFYFEIFFINSKFHELRQLGAVFIHRAAGEGVMSCISVLNFFFGVPEAIFI